MAPLYTEMRRGPTSINLLNKYVTKHYFYSNNNPNYLLVVSKSKHQESAYNSHICNTY